VLLFDNSKILPHFSDSSTVGRLNTIQDVRTRSCGVLSGKGQQFVSSQ